MFLSSLLLFVFIGCESSDNNDDDGAALIDTPTEYSFESRFSSGENSVSYSGQVVRNLLINDIKTQMGADAASGNPARVRCTHPSRATYWRGRLSKPHAALKHSSTRADRQTDGPC